MSRTFLKFFGFFEGFQPPQNPHKLLLWAFQRLSLAGQLDYITTGCHTLSTGFLIFSTNFGRNFWAVCILWWVGVLAQVVGKFAGMVEKSLPLGGKVARYAPDEGDLSGSCPLISHLR